MRIMSISPFMKITINDDAKCDMPNKNQTFSKLLQSQKIDFIEIKLEKG